MNKQILLSIISIPLLLHSEVTLDVIEVTTQDEQDIVNTTGFAGDTVFQKEGYMEATPMQKQISGERAMQVAGSNGDPIKALQAFAGIASTSNDLGSEIYIHGSKPRETQFTINHLPVGYIFHLGGLHSVIAPEMTGQMDAYLGGYDVTYGSMGAVVDITPKYPTGSGHGHVHIGLYDADFAYDAKLGENTSLFISARRSYFDLFADKIVNELDTDKDDARKKTTYTLFPQFNDAQIVLTHQAGDNIFSVEYITAHDKFKVDDTFNIEKDPVAVGKLNGNYEFNTLGARWIHEGENVTNHTLLYRLFSKNNSSFFDADYFVKTESTEYGLYHETIWNLDKHRITLGGKITSGNTPTKVHSNAPATTDFDNPISQQDVIDLNTTFKTKEYTLFAQDIWDITSDNHFRFGVRAYYTDFQNFGSGIDPRVAYVHDISNDFTISAAVGRYTQIPSAFMVVEEFGNPKIDTREISNHYTLSLQKSFADNSSLVVEPYYKTFENLAITDEIHNYEAVGEGSAYGIDFTYSKKIDDFDFMLAYSYIKAQRQLNTNSTKQYRFEGDIPHTLQVSTNYHFGNNWRTSAYAKYSSGAPYTPIVGTTPYTYQGKNYLQPIYGTPYSKRLDANYDLDIQIAKIYKYTRERSLEVSLELMNVNALFKKNVDSIQYNDKYEEDGVSEQFGFLPALHLTYKF